jgi:hypothetical protein
LTGELLLEVVKAANSTAKVDGQAIKNRAKLIEIAVTAQKLIP